MKKKILGICIASIFTVVVVLITAAICFHVNSGPTASVAADQASVVTTGSVNNVGASGTIAIPGFKQLTMKAEETVQAVKFVNPEQNACYMVITIILPDKTQIYKSGMLAPGKELNTIELSQKLAAGTYEGAILQYSCYGLENKQELNGAETIFTLEVK